MSNCNICYGSLDGEIINCPHCQNSFHRDHLAAWLLIQSFCPVCRQQMPSGLLSKLAPKDEADMNRLMSINRNLDSMSQKVAQWERKDKRKNKLKYTKRKRKAMNEYVPPDKPYQSFKDKIGPIFIFLIFMVFIIAINS